ncbi:MAG: pyridine nucleotide-disulfide oxidoreductase [Oceanococcus sp.]|nr:MAG: pyridine nucleotide-disulfide oxidoreductase [Oceanococcus sp.]
MSTDNIVIVGGGQAGATLAQELRKLGFEGGLTIIGEEPQLPYRRPPLSKAYLAGEASEESLYVMKAPILEKNNVSFRGGVRVTQIDRDNKTLTLDNGETLNWDKLALTTGGRARPLPVQGADAQNVFELRSVADVDAIRPHCQAGKRAVIIGGGFIGLEVAAVARKLGVEVSVLEGLPRVLARVTAPQVSEFFETVHRDAGVDLRTGAAVTAIEGNPVSHVVLESGERLAADFVVVGIGLIPNTELASMAGLEVDNGIVVDAQARTSDPNVVAAGDCTNLPSAFYNRRIRLESVNNAMEQARIAAATLLGQDKTYDAVPWFWSDQYDLKLQMVGLSEGYDNTVLRGDPATRSFSLFYLKDGVVIAADAVSQPKDFMAAKKLVAARAAPDPEALGNPDQALADLIPA